MSARNASGKPRGCDDVFAACADIASVQDKTLAGSRSIAGRARPVKTSPWSAQISAGWRTAQPWVRGLLAAQLAAIAVLGSLLVTDSRNEATYHMLGASNRSTQSRDAIAVIFDPSITESELRRVVSGVGARIVDGPTSMNAFVLEVPATQLDHAVQGLRAEHSVRFAARLGAATGP